MLLARALAERGRRLCFPLALVSFLDLPFLAALAAEVLCAEVLPFVVAAVPAGLPTNNAAANMAAAKPTSRMALGNLILLTAPKYDSKRKRLIYVAQ